MLTCNIIQVTGVKFFKLIKAKQLGKFPPLADA